MKHNLTCILGAVTLSAFLTSCTSVTQRGPAPIPNPSPLRSRTNLQKKDLPKPVRGIDFWENDATHVPISPTRNLMPNPSFEQGFRYWTWEGGGGAYSIDPNQSPMMEVVEQGHIGKQALAIHPGAGNRAIRSFPIQLQNGKSYTLSFYAKAVNCAPGRTVNVKASLSSAAIGGKLGSAPWGDSANPDSQFKVSDQWKRYSRTFTADDKGVKIHLGAGGDVLIDAIQLEEGTKPTEFVSFPIEAKLVSADPDNDLSPDQNTRISLIFYGKPAARAKGTITIYNAYRETLVKRSRMIKIGRHGTSRLRLPVNVRKFGTGVFIVRLDMESDGLAPYTEYYRFSILERLQNTHPTKNMFGTLLCFTTTPRGYHAAKKYMEWGFGSTSWLSIPDASNPKFADMLRTFRIQNVQTAVGGTSGAFKEMFPERPDPWRNSTLVYGLSKVEPKYLKILEDCIAKSMKNVPVDMMPYCSFGNEEEGTKLPGTGNFDEYAKWQKTTRDAIRKINPDFKFTPTSGTTCITDGQIKTLESYVTAAEKKGFQYDAISVHVYSYIDGGSLGHNDLNEATKKLIDMMARHGMQDKPIMYTEAFNVPETCVPQWNAGGCYDNYQSGKPTYDLGNREFLQAASAVRLYIHGLKFWPKVQSINIWVSRPFLDTCFTPLMLNGAVNALARLMPDVKWVDDVMPEAGVRGFVFQKPDKTAIAPLWCFNPDIDQAVAEGMDVTVKFRQEVQFVDMMGNRRKTVWPDAKGITKIHLTPAPLYLIAKDPKMLAEDLKQAKTGNSALAVSATFLPQEDGRIRTTVYNLTGLSRAGKIKVGKNTIPYEVKPSGSQVSYIPGDDVQPVFGKMYQWNTEYQIVPTGATPTTRLWKMDYFFAPEVKDGKPDWDKIPKWKLTNWHELKKGKTIKPDDLNVTWQLAWAPKKLYIRVDVEDDKFMTFEKDSRADKQLWVFDGALELYFDTKGNGRSNLKQGFDMDDYRYDIAMPADGKTGKARVWRMQEAYHQYAGGLDMPSKEAAAKGINAQFIRTARGCTYLIELDEKYVLPGTISKGSVMSFALYVHDHDAPDWKDHKGISSATEAGSHTDYKPHVWPIMILK